jgi:hypothetical protein
MYPPHRERFGMSLIDNPHLSGIRKESSHRQGPSSGIHDLVRPKDFKRVLVAAFDQCP